MKQLIEKTKVLSVFLLVLIMGCDTDDALLPKVISSFTYTVNEDTGTVTFINISEQARTYEWDFGDGDTSTEISPVKTYTESGTYTVSLTATNNSGASATFEDDITIVIKVPITVPITFDNSNVNYNAITAFGGSSFEIVQNPDVSGTKNVVSNVGAITNVGVAFEGVFFDLGTPIDLATDKTITMNFWSEEAVSVLLKLENGTGPATEVTASHGGTGWETLTFDYSSSASFGRLTLFVDGPGTTSGTFYIDDINQESSGTVECTEETEENIDPANGDLKWTFKTNDATHTFDAFGNTSGAIVSNPVTDGINPSCNVQQFVKATGCETFAGLGYELATALDFSTITNKVFTMKVLAETQVTDVTLRLERLPFPDTEPSQDRVASITQVGEWQELTFDFSDVSTGTFKSMIIYFERNAECDGDVYYFDDILQVSGSGGGGGGNAPTSSAPVPPARDAADVISIYGGTYTNISGINYDPNWGQSGFGLVNPAYDPGDGNLALAYPTFNYQGTDFSGNAQDASAMEFLHVDIWVPTGTDRQVKVSPINGGTGVGEFLVQVPLTPGSWNSVDLPIASFTGMTWDNVVQLKFDGQFNGDGSANTTPYDIYLDNIYFYKQPAGGGGGSSLATNGDFETGDDTGWLLFQNNGTAALDNTLSNGGSWSGRLTVGDTGGNPAFKQERIGAGTVSSGDTVQVQFDHIGTITQPGAIVNVLLFGEGAGGTVSFTQPLAPGPALTGSWTTYTGSFTIPGGADVSEGISVLIETVCGAVTGCNVVMNIDNVSVTLNP